MSEQDTRLVAVIELGTTSIRMEIAQLSPSSEATKLDFFQQPVSLGKDAFTNGTIANETIEDCVSALRSFRQILEEYRIMDGSCVTAIATSAVREASNRDAFLDRIYIATGITVEALDEAEVSRLNCLAVTPIIQNQSTLKKNNTIVVEVGGGSTEVLIFEHGQILSSHTYRLGSLRLRKMFEDFRTPISRIPAMMQSHIKRVVEQMLQETPGVRISRMVILGGDARFAATKLKKEKRGGTSLTRVMSNRVSKLAKDILSLTPDQLVKKDHLAYPDAETLGPALLIYTMLARALDLRSMLVGTATLREGALADMSSDGSWTEEFKEQVIHSTIELGEKYSFDKNHALNVADFSTTIFDALQSEHNMAPRYRFILQVTALLHDIGSYVSNRSHHKHSMYLIQNSDIFGLGSKDILIISMVARYHRRALPKQTHASFNNLNREDRIIVSKLAAILRVADALDRRHIDKKHDIKVDIDQGIMTITIRNAGDLSLEKHGMPAKADLFEQVYGMKVELQG